MSCKSCLYFIPLSACELSPIETNEAYSCDKETSKTDKIKEFETKIEKEIDEVKQTLNTKADKI